jgi:hypothetical protein
LIKLDFTDLEKDEGTVFTVEDIDIANKTVHLVDLFQDSEAWARNYVARVLKTNGGKALPLGWTRDRNACEDEEDPLCQFDSSVDDKDIVKLAQKITENGSRFEKLFVHEASLVTHFTAISSIKWLLICVLRAGIFITHW